MKWNLAIALFLLGIVDQIDGDKVIVEVTTSDYTVKEIEMHKSLFPCEVSEGDMFYFAYADGVTEIRCGEPPE
jgi:hypothetical protein